MNGLSWVIFFSGLIQPITVFFILCAVFVGTIAILHAIGILFNYDNIKHSGDNCLAHEKENYIKECADKIIAHKRYARNCSIFCFIFIIISVLIPTRETVLLITASEIGGNVIASDDAKKIINPGMEYLQMRIQQELDNLKKGK